MKSAVYAGYAPTSLTTNLFHFGVSLRLGVEFLIIQEKARCGRFAAANQSNQSADSGTSL